MSESTRSSAKANATFVTGATGFLGSAVVRKLARLGYLTIAGSRAASIAEQAFEHRLVNYVSIDSSSETLGLGDALLSVETVVHCAARVHVMQDAADDPLSIFREVNRDMTVALARHAAKAGVRRFIFISSIKVNGEQTRLGQPFTAEDGPAPTDAYGVSKMEAEEALRCVAEETGMEVVIIRPPLVYGPGVKGNFATMIKLVEKGLPLPLGAIHNKRSLVALDNLVDLIITCLDHPEAGGQVFLAGDGEDLSTTELLQGIGKAMGKPARLVPVPASALMFGASLLGKKLVAQRVLGSLQVEISKASKMLGWEPPLTVEEGLRRCFDSESEC